MQAEVTRLFDSPSVRMIDWRCRQESGASSKTEYAPRFEITFTRTGSFQQKEGKRVYHIDSTAVLLKNAGTEYSVDHTREVRDTCTVLQLKEPLLEEALRKFWKKSNPYTNTSLHFPVPVLRSTPQLDHLHHRLLLLVRNTAISGVSLKLDVLFMDVLETVYAQLFGNAHMYIADPARKQDHIHAVERGKEYILQHFTEDLRLDEISKHSFASAFHFSRLFKRITGTSPYQYLLEVRLKHAALLLRNTRLPVTEICFEAGFNSLSHFIATFSRLFRISPREYRRR